MSGSRGAYFNRELLSSSLGLTSAIIVHASVLQFGGNVPSGQVIIVTALAAWAILLFLAYSLKLLTWNNVDDFGFIVLVLLLLTSWPLLQIVIPACFGSHCGSWGEAGFLFGFQRTAQTLSIDMTILSLLVSGGAGLSFVVSIVALSSPAARFAFAAATILFACANALYGLENYASGRNSVLGEERELWLHTVAGGIVSGTFINKTHFAVYLCIGQIFCFWMAKWRSGRVLVAKAKWKFHAESMFFLFVIVCGFFIFPLAVILSGSRGAIVISGLLAMLLLSVYVRKFARFVALLAFLLAVLVPFLTDFTVRRFVNLTVDAAQRFAVVRQTFRAIIDTKGVGVGAGSFEVTFPIYRTDLSGAPLMWNAAHASMVELFFTHGFLWFFLLFLFAALFCRYILRNRSRVSVISILSLCFVLLQQSLFDFGFQTFGLLVVFSASLAFFSLPEDSFRVRRAGAVYYWSFLLMIGVGTVAVLFSGQVNQVSSSPLLCHPLEAREVRSRIDVAMASLAVAKTRQEQVERAKVIEKILACRLSMTPVDGWAAAMWGWAVGLQGRSEETMRAVNFSRKFSPLEDLAIRARVLAGNLVWDVLPEESRESLFYDVNLLFKTHHNYDVPSVLAPLFLSSREGNPLLIFVRRNLSDFGLNYVQKFDRAMEKMGRSSGIQG